MKQVFFKHQDGILSLVILNDSCTVVLRLTESAALQLMGNLDQEINALQAHVEIIKNQNADETESL